MAMIKKATYRQVVSALSYVFKCLSCGNIETHKEHAELKRKCGKCGEDMQLVSSCFEDKQDSKHQ